MSGQQHCQDCSHARTVGLDTGGRLRWQCRQGRIDGPPRLVYKGEEHNEFRASLTKPVVCADFDSMDDEAGSPKPKKSRR